MAILDRVYSLRQRPTYDLKINGTPLVPDQPLSLDGRPAVYSLRGGESYENPVPYLNIEVSRIPSEWMRKGQSVNFDAGYDIEHVRRFTGGVYALGEEDPDYLRTQCIGTGAVDADGNRIERSASIIGGPAVWPPITGPIDFGVDNHLIHDNATMEEVVVRELGERARIPRRPNDSRERQTIQCKGDLWGAFRDYKIPARDLSGEDVEDAIEAILDESGIASHNVNSPAYTLAAEGATLDRMNGAAMIAKLMQIKGCHVQQLSSGLVLVRVIQMRPAPTSAFTYSTTAQQYARIISADPPLLKVPFNPLLQIGQTITLQLDYLGIDARYFLQGHEWEIGPGGAFSYLDLRGGDEFGGTIGIDPVASFTYEAARQVIGDSLYIVLTFTDTSIDPDGSINQALSTWSSNQTTTPNINTFNGEPVATVRIKLSDITGDFTVTRHAVDNDGRTHDHTEILDIEATSSAVTVPPLYVASGTRRMVTPDAAENWNDTTPSSKTATAIGARLADGISAGHGAFGHSDGSIDVTRDFGVSVAAALAAISPTSQFMDVQWDWRDHRLCWALTDDARLYLSNDYAVSFFLYANFRTLTYGGFGGTTPGALGNLIGLPAGGGVYVSGGDGAGRPLIAFNTNLLAPTWLRVAHTGDLLTDLVTPADATMRIVAYAAPGYDGEDMILSWASGGVGTLVAIYRTTDGPGLAKNYSRATGLTAGLKNGRVMMESGPLSPIGRIAMFGDRDVWRRPVNSLAWTEISDVLPSGFTPNHGLYASSLLSPMSAVYEHLLAVEDATGTGGVMKSTDEAETFNFIRPATGPGKAWVAGAKAKKISIGAPGLASSGFELFAQMNGGSQETLACTGAIWTEQSTDSANDNWHLKNLNGVLYRIANKLASTNIAGPGDLERSPDNGVTWTIVLAKSSPSGVQSVTIGQDGTLWALWGSQSVPSTNVLKVYKSVDNGETWTLEYTDADASGLIPVDIACHPTNAAIVAVTCVRNSGGARLLYSSNTGVAFTQRTLGVTTNGTNGLWVTFADSGRIIVAGGGGLIQTTDTVGVTWTTRDDPAGAESTFIVRFGTRILYGVGSASGDGGSVRISTDEATTWSEYVNGDSIDSLLANEDPYGICLDQSGGLCLMFTGSLLTSNWWRNAAPWAATLPAWTSIAFNGDAVSTGTISLQGLAAGPDTQ